MDSLLGFFFSKLWPMDSVPGVYQQVNDSMDSLLGWFFSKLMAPWTRSRGVFSKLMAPWTRCWGVFFKINGSMDLLLG